MLASLASSAQPSRDRVKLALTLFSTWMMLHKYNKHCSEIHNVQCQPHALHWIVIFSGSSTGEGKIKTNACTWK